MSNNKVPLTKDTTLVGMLRRCSTNLLTYTLSPGRFRRFGQEKGTVSHPRRWRPIRAFSLMVFEY